MIMTITIKGNKQIVNSFLHQNMQRQNKIPKAFVPFGSMEPKSKEPTSNPTSLVGPGSYNIDVQHSGEKIIVSSETEDIKILEISRPHPVFKSGVERFKDAKEQNTTPGPGEYNLKGLQVRPKMIFYLLISDEQLPIKQIKLTLFYLHATEIILVYF